MVNQVLETSHSPSSPTSRLCVSVAVPSSILRTHFQVPYRATPLFATLTKTAGACTQNSRFGNAHLSVHCRRLWSQREKKRAQHPDKVGTGAAPYKEANEIRI